MTRVLVAESYVFPAAEVSFVFLHQVPGDQNLLSLLPCFSNGLSTLSNYGLNRHDWTPRDKKCVHVSCVSHILLYPQERHACVRNGKAHILRKQTCLTVVGRGELNTTEIFFSPRFYFGDLRVLPNV